MLARVEGEGSLVVKIKPDEKIDVQLGIFEPPRFFEAFLVGRRHDEAPDITARICGICPIAYQISSATAMERALRVEVAGPVFVRSGQGPQIGEGLALGAGPLTDEAGELRRVRGEPLIEGPGPQGCFAQAGVPHYSNLAGIHILIRFKIVEYAA